MVYTVAQSYQTFLAMDERQPRTTVPDRIRFDVQDEEVAGAARSHHGRKGSTAVSDLPAFARSSTVISEDNVSLRPGSRRSSMAIEPAAALPIQYRTL